MVSTLTVALGLLAVPLAAAGKVAAIASRTTPTTGPLTSPGTFQVLVGTGGDVNGTTSYVTTTPDDAVGCLNADGKVTLDDCAVFTPVDTYFVETTAGVCSFDNSSSPTNSDDVYGSNIHALACWDHTPSLNTDIEFYTVQGTSYYFLGTGDADLYYDIPGLPETETDALNFWYYVWGGEEEDVPEGHYKALLLWVPSS